MSRSRSTRATTGARRRRASTTSTTRSSPSSPARAASRSRAPRARPCGSPRDPRTRRCCGSTSGSACTGARTARWSSRSTWSTRASRPTARCGWDRAWSRSRSGRSPPTARGAAGCGSTSRPATTSRCRAATSTSRDRTTDGGVTLSTQPLGEPLTYFAYVVGQREAVYKETPLTVAAGDRDVALVIRGWRDDPAWAGRISGVFRKALPELSREIGLPWPEDEPTVVQEAVSRAAGGYAGLFAPADRRIEVAYWADPLVVLHEAAHGWFNGALVADRWASEGFASLYAQRAAGKLKVRDTSPKLTAAVNKAAIPLNGVAEHDRHRGRRRSGRRDLRLRRVARAGARRRQAGRRRGPAAGLGGGRCADRRVPARDGRGVRRRRR